MNPKETFKTAEEREKYVLSMFQGVMADMEAGVIKDFGYCVDGSGGYCIYEAQNEADVFKSLRKWLPHIVYDARQVFTVDQLKESRKGDTGQAGRQIS